MVYRPTAGKGLIRPLRNISYNDNEEGNAMITKLKMFIFAAIAVAALWSGAAYAAEPDAGSALSKAFMEKMDAKRDQLYKELNLTDEQKKALEENKNQHRAEFKALFENMRAKRDLMREELQKDALNMDKVNQIEGELKQLQSQMSDQRLQGILEVRKILTPEQFKKFMANMEEHKGRFDREGKGQKNDSKKGPQGSGEGR